MTRYRVRAIAPKYKIGQVVQEISVLGGIYIIEDVKQPFSDKRIYHYLLRHPHPKGQVDHWAPELVLRPVHPAA